ncbi:MAG: hypothetical protein KDI76_00645 [Xanthomonadales bacterium]|jgi:hypothetical protein|nr:hypothetical protein [Xanthomonadales bacterium]
MINFEKIYKSLGNYRLVYGMCLIPILLGIIIDSHNPNSHDDIRLVVFIGIPLYIGTFLAVVIDGFINYISKKRTSFDKKVISFYLLFIFLVTNIAMLYIGM